jgi:hypothetical protein
LILVWALLTWRFAAVAIGAAFLVVAALAATVVLGGFGVWADYIALLRNVSDPITTPHNFTPGAVAYQAGVPRGSASLIQWVSMAFVAVAFVGAALWLPAVPSYLIAVVASQLVSPILWDHYALILLLPVAWLIERGWTWAALIPLATCILLIGFVPPVTYPIAFGVTLFALLAAGFQDRGRRAFA